MRRILLLLVSSLLAAGLVSACSDESPVQEETTTAGVETTSDGETTATDGPPSTTAAQAAGEEDLVVETVAGGLDTPWEIRFLPDGDLLVTERPGRLVRIELPEGRVVPMGEVPAEESGEGGLMGFDLDPDFPDEPFVYLAYTYEGEAGTTNRLSRFTLSDGRISEEKVLLDGIPGAGNHNGSRVAFGPDGFLWMTTGDASQGELAQDRDSPAGKVLRLDKEGKPASENPSPDSPVFSLGHRNAQGLTWHPGTSQAFVTEHGPNANDEVNRLEPGGNYGWPEVGGKAGDPRFVDPLISWTPTIAPTGAVFYDQEAIPGWQGSLLFVTLKDRDLRRLVPVDEEFTEVAEEQILFDEEFGRLRAIAVGEDGALYLATSNKDGRGSPQEEDDRILKISYQGG